MAKVLIVDDDPAMLMLMSREIEGSGFDVQTAEGGREALKELCRATLNGGSFEVILLDIAMPDINGWRVLDAIKANPLWTDAKIIVVSGYSQSPQALMRVTKYDGVFIEKDGDFQQMVVRILARLTAEPVVQ
ncbi:MAG TPA: response regulator [Armatimonadota bacterium]|nr:response regulator [Armatimonadota bacterium]